MKYIEYLAEAYCTTTGNVVCSCWCQNYVISLLCAV